MTAVQQVNSPRGALKLFAPKLSRAIRAAAAEGIEMVLLEGKRPIVAIEYDVFHTRNRNARACVCRACGGPLLQGQAVVEFIWQGEQRCWVHRGVCS